MHRMFLPLLALLVASVSAFAKTVGNEAELRALGASDCSSDITLTADITMSNDDFTPLCSKGYTGVFDGGNHTISNLHISADLKNGVQNVAFIAVLNGGVLKDLTFEGPVISVTQSNGNGNVGSGTSSVAVAVGDLQGGSVENIHVKNGKVTVSGGTKVTADAGGIAGTAESGEISESGGDIALSSTGGSVTLGGICGSVTGEVTLTSVSYTGDAPFAGNSGDQGISIKYGALTVTEKNSVKTVDIDGDYMGTDAVEIPTNIAVSSVTLNRTFTENVISTLYVPFEIAASDVVGASVYQFNTVEKNESDGRWKFKVLTTETVEANTPYIILPSATQVTFDATSFILNTSNPVTHSKGKWEFKGTYELVTFEETSDDAFYVFAGQAANGAKLGEFVKSSGYANPMRAYLIYHKNANVTAKSASGSLGSNILLPDELDIEIEDENGVVVQTGTLNTVTGEVRMDRWYDLKGRKLNSKPTVKGTYYKNGKKAIIK